MPFLKPFRINHALYDGLRYLCQDKEKPPVEEEGRPGVPWECLCETNQVWGKPDVVSTHLFEVVMPHDVAGEEPALAGRFEEVLPEIGVHVEVAIGLAAGELDFEGARNGVIPSLNDR